MNPNPQDRHTRRVYLLGQLHIEAGREQIALRGGKVRALFAYLALHPNRQHGRERVADLLWPDAPAARVRRNFSDVLYRLRQTLGPGWLDADRESVGLHGAADLWVDVWVFEQQVKAEETAVLAQAVSLYTGDLLPEIYDDWILERRLALRETHLNSLLKLGRAAEQQTNFPEAQSYFQQLAHADPLREEAQRGLMRSLASQGRLPEALTVYANLEAHLNEELGVPPAAQTRSLADQLRSELILAQTAADLPHNQLVERPFVGRVQERATILAAVEAAIAGQGGIIAIEGDAGMGKSRLLQEIEASAQWRGVTLLIGRAAEYPAASPYAPLCEALADTLASPRAIQLETLLPPETLAACAPLHPPWRDLASLPTLPPARACRRFQQALAAVWQALANLAPHLLVLDDLHWTDADLWAALDALVPSLRQQRLLLLLTYRRPAIIEHGYAWELLQKWERAGLLTALPLKPLAVDEVAQLLPPNMQSEAARVQASAGGSPFFISEMLIDLAEGHAPHRRIALVRAESLPAPARAALETAAALGNEVPYRLWATITDLPPVALAKAGEMLAAHYLLKPAPTGYLFTHDLIHDALYKNIAPERRVRLHRRIADALAAYDAKNLRARAFHLDKAGAAIEAAALYRQAAAQALAEHAFIEAQTALNRVLALTPAAPSKELVETLLTLAQVCHVTGDRERQQSALDEAQLVVRPLSDDALLLQVLIHTGDLVAKTGAQAEAQAHLEEALALARRLDDKAAQVETLLFLGDLAIRFGQYKAAQTHMEAALALARAQALPRQEGRALDGLGYVMMHLSDDLPVVIDYFEQALAVQRAAGDKFGESRTLSNMLGACQNLGAWDRLLAMADEVLAAQAAVSYRLGTAVARQAQGLAACMLGDFDQAQQVLALAQTGFAAVGEQLGVGVAANALGLVAERRGDLTAAETYYREALAIAETAVAPSFIAFAQQDLGRLYLQMNDAARAIPLLASASNAWQAQEDALNYLRCQAALGLAYVEIGESAPAIEKAEAGWAALQKEAPMGEEPQIWLWTLYRLLTAVNRPDKAEKALRAAYRELQRQAQAIADAEMRRRFFARVPLHQEIVAAYDRLTNNSGVVSVTLAAQDAPLGRPLAPAEMATVRWTVAAPEDAAITGKAALRRHRLQRLLTEAEAQGAAPTDDDLAQALGVSRRTILRDMEQLTQAGVVLPTRRRRAG